MLDSGAPNVQRNRILNALSNADLALLQPHLGQVSLPFRLRLQSTNRHIDNVYFPEGGIASIVAVGGGEREQAQVALVGREGMTGLPIVLGAERSPCDVFMQVGGEGQCISTQKLLEVMSQSTTVLNFFLRYAHVFSLQCGYTAFANAQGTIEERLARWLLMTHDRVAADQIPLTHEFIALMLGVRRAGVTLALQAFASKGLIETARRSVTVKDRDGLEEVANCFYGAPEAEFERLFASDRNT